MPTKASTGSTLYSIEATAQLAQVLPARQPDEPGCHFEDLPPDLQNVLRVQLRQPGDVSALVETSHGFFVYVLKSRTTEVMAVASSSIVKRVYENWLAEQKTNFNSTPAASPPHDP